MVFIVAYLAILMLFWTGTSWAYIDPNAGSLLWQVTAPLFALFVTSLLYFRQLTARWLKSVWQKIESNRGAYLVSLGAVAAATVLNAFLRDLSVNATFLVFMVATVVTASFGGFGPSILATVLSAVSSTYLFLAPKFALAIASSNDRKRLLLFVFCAVISALAIERKQIVAGTSASRQKDGRSMVA